MNALAAARAARREVIASDGAPFKDRRYHVRLHPHAVYDMCGDPELANVFKIAGTPKNTSVFETEFRDLPWGLRLFEDSSLPKDEVRVVGRDHEGKEVVVTMKWSPDA